MRLLLVVPSFPKLSETFIVAKVLGLLERGYDVHVACDRSDEREWARFPRLAARADMRARVHRNWPTAQKWRAGLAAPAALASVATRAPAATRRYLRVRPFAGPLRTLRGLYQDASVLAARPDVLHFEFGALAVGRMHLKRTLGARVAVSFRGADLNYIGLERPDFYDEVWRDADALHFLGQDLWRRAQRRGCRPDARHACIAPAIDVARFARVPDAPREALGMPARPLRLLSVGRLHWKKGHEYAIEAVAKLAARGVTAELRIVGDGDFRAPLEFARHQLGVRGVVELAGARSPEQILADLAWCDVFVHAAVSEGFSNAVIEAQAAARPVVCSDADGLPENVAHGETGLVVPRRDSTRLADALAALAADPTRRARMAEAGRARAHRLFQLDRQLDAWEAFYRDVVPRAN
jgi:colanic acid/amylovoran biosynthesis glycosyltransferase